MRKVILGLVAAVSALIIILLVVGGVWYLNYLSPFMKSMKHTTVIPYDKQLTLVLGGGGNSGILVCDSAVLVIDTKMDEAADSLARMVKALAGNKPIIVVNTHIHPDHTKGNKFYQGKTIIAGGNYSKDFWIKSAGAETLPNVWIKDSALTLPFGDETVTIVNVPWTAHTQSDLVVYLNKRKMLFAGDLVLNHVAPAIINGANPYGYLMAFDSLQSWFAIDKVVPGHGDIGGPEVINNFRAYFNDMKTAAADPSREKELLARYSDWRQIPMLMSPSATEACFKKKNP